MLGTVTGRYNVGRVMFRTRVKVRVWSIVRDRVGVIVTGDTHS